MTVTLTAVFSFGIFLTGLISLILGALKMMLKPIENQLANRVTDTDKKIDRIEKKLDDLLSLNRK